MLALGLVLGVPGCLAGPQPDPPGMRGDNPGVGADAGPIDPGARRDAGRPPASDSGGGGFADAGAGPPPEMDDRFSGAASSFDDAAEADGEEPRRTERRNDIWQPEDLFPIHVPTPDAGAADSGPDDGDAETM